MLSVEDRGMNVRVRDRLRLRPDIATSWLVVAGTLVAILAGATLAVGSVTAAGPTSNATVGPVDETVPQDLNGDGKYMDLNANGRVDSDDVVTYFRYSDDPALTRYADAYDYNDNGRTDYDDISTLFDWTTPPTATFDANTTTVASGTPISFDASGSTDGGSIDDYAWSFGDGMSATGSTATHTYTDPGSYDVTLTVTDDDGVTNTTTRTVTVRSTADNSTEKNQSSGTVGNASDERVTAYYTSWARYDRDYQPADVPLDQITHLNYAFLDVKRNGTVVLGDSWGDTQNLQAFRERAKNHSNTTMLLSIGGWSYSDQFSNAALTEERRQRFAKTAVALMRKYDFDGIDIDWEYPGGGGKQGNVAGPTTPTTPRSSSRRFGRNSTGPSDRTDRSTS